jgi:Fe-S-cluster containining protein
MYTDAVPFKCHHCNHCCTDVVCLPTPWDVRRIMRMTGQDPFDFLEFLTPEEIDDVDDDDPTWLVLNGEKYMMALKRDETLGCHFLNRDTKYCSIYEARPLLCRLYPFKVEETPDEKFLGFTLHEDVGCPKHSDGLVPVKPLYDLFVQDSINGDDYSELVEFFNAQDYPGKEIEDFVVMFTGGFLKLKQNLEEQAREKAAEATPPSA